METKSNYTMVGVFVLSFVIAFFAFVLWISNAGFGKKNAEYHIYFSGSVSGLKDGSTVNYRGVPIGLVKSIDIDPEDVEKIRVKIAIDAHVLIKESMVASLEMQGITGIAYVQINGGSQSDPELRRETGQELPVIPSRSSLLEQVSGSIPELITKFIHLVDDMRTWFSDDNRKSFSETLLNIQAITESFDPSNQEGHKLMISLHEAANNMNKTLQELSGVSHEIRKILDENRKGLRDFSASGLTAFTKFLQEGQETLSTFRRIGESLERSPTRFFHQDSTQGVPLKK